MLSALEGLAYARWLSSHDDEQDALMYAISLNNLPVTEQDRKNVHQSPDAHTVDKSELRPNATKQEQRIQHYQREPA